MDAPVVVLFIPQHVPTNEVLFVGLDALPFSLFPQRNLGSIRRTSTQVRQVGEITSTETAGIARWTKLPNQGGTEGRRSEELGVDSYKTEEVVQSMFCGRFNESRVYMRGVCSAKPGAYSMWGRWWSEVAPKRSRVIGCRYFKIIG